MVCCKVISTVGKKKTEQNKRIGNADVGAGRELMFPIFINEW